MERSAREAADLIGRYLAGGLELSELLARLAALPPLPPGEVALGVDPGHLSPAARRRFDALLAADGHT